VAPDTSTLLDTSDAYVCTTIISYSRGVQIAPAALALARASVVQSNSPWSVGNCRDVCMYVCMYVCMCCVSCSIPIQNSFEPFSVYALCLPDRTPSDTSQIHSPQRSARASERIAASESDAFFLKRIREHESADSQSHCLPSPPLLALCVLYRIEHTSLSYQIGFPILYRHALPV
jgi:hypothetical protein